MVLIAELATLGFEKNDDGTGVLGFTERAALDERGLRRGRVPWVSALALALVFSSMEGTNTFVTMAASTQNTTIGNANFRASLAARGRLTWS